MILRALATAFAAFCVWLTVRIVNRRERWAKWTAAAMVGLPVLYVASFGPACWITSRTTTGARLITTVYRPILLIRLHRSWAIRPIDVYAKAGAADGWDWWELASDDINGNRTYDWSWRKIRR